MKITSLLIENFMAIGTAELKLDDKGLVLVQGDNQDDSSQHSNGAGKSSILDALSWCLFDTTARGDSGDDIINNTAKKDCRVVVSIQQGDTSHIISRHRKHHEGKNRLDYSQVQKRGLGVALTQGTNKLTQAKVNEAIGCSADVFNAAVYIGQEQMPNLPAMTDSQLKLLIEEAAGIDRLQAAHQIAMQNLNKAEGEHNRLSNEITSLDKRIADIQAILSDAEEKAKTWEAGHKRKLTEATSELRQRKQEYDTAVSEFNKQYPDKDKRITAGIRRAEEETNAVSGEKAKKQELEKALRRAQSIAEKASFVFEVDYKELAARKKTLDLASSKVGEPCDACGKPHTKEDMEEVTKIASTKLRAQAVKTKASKADSLEASESLSKHAAELKQYESTMTDISAVSGRRLTLERELSEYQRAEDTLVRRKAELTRGVNELKSMKTESNPLSNTLRGQKQRLEDVQQQRRSTEAAVIVAEKELKVSKAVTTVYGRTGVRAHILDTVTPYLNARTSEYISVLSDGNITAAWNTLSSTKKGEVREKFQIAVTSSTGAKSFRGLSGGEKRKVRLACSMALQDLVASRAVKPIELYVCDEIDDALDDAGLERLMTVLEEKAKDRGTVLVVSHNDLASWINQSVTVKKEHGKAVIEGDALS